jgi:hypothetical protein
MKTKEDMLKVIKKWYSDIANIQEATTFPPLLGKVGRSLPTLTTFPTLHFPTLAAAIIKSITFPAHVF